MVATAFLALKSGTLMPYHWRATAAISITPCLSHVCEPIYLCMYIPVCVGYGLQVHSFVPYSARMCLMYLSVILAQVHILCLGIVHALRTTRASDSFTESTVLGIAERYF